MKNFLLGIALMSSFSAPAAEITVQCDYVISNGKETTALKSLTESFDEAEDKVIKITSELTPGVELTARFSAKLKSLDTHIFDSRNGVEAQGPDWFNANVTEAGSAVTLTNAQGEYFLLQCYIHEGE